MLRKFVSRASEKNYGLTNPKMLPLPLYSSGDSSSIVVVVVVVVVVVIGRRSRVIVVKAGVGGVLKVVASRSKE